MILNVIVPMKIPEEKDARSARNLNGCLYSLLIIEATKNGDATNSEIAIVYRTDSIVKSLYSIILFLLLALEYEIHDYFLIYI